MTTKKLACGLLIGGVTMAASAFPAPAGATDYTVPPGSGPAFADALAKAQGNPGPDRIFLGAGYYTAPDAGGFAYYKPGDPVEIVGTGREGPQATIINGQPGGNTRTLSLAGGPGTLIRDLRIDLPIGAAAGTNALQTTGTAKHILVFAKDVQQSNSRTGVALNGGTLEDSIVDIGQNNDSYGVIFDDGGPGTVRDSAVSGTTAIISSYGGLIERSRMTGAATGVQTYRNLTTIRSSDIEVQGPKSWGVAAFTSAGSDDSVVIDGVNILGPGGPDTRGVWANSNAVSKQTVTLTNSLLRGFTIPLFADSDTHITASYSDYDGIGNKDLAGGTGISESNISNVGDAGFAAPGDYHLVTGSPLVDAGDPAAAQGLDLGGNPLVADGNADGTARRDIGAYELAGQLPGEQPQPGGGSGEPSADTQAPVLSGFASSRKAFARKTRFRYTLSEAARVTITIQRAIRGSRTRYRTVGTITRSAPAGASSTVFTGRIGKRLLRSGRYRAVARATDAAKNRSAPRRAAFRIAR
jgi:hypothetical protein